LRLLALDPGAERLGWAVLEGGPGQTLRYLDSGISRCPRGVRSKDKKEPYQEYRLRMVEEMAFAAIDLLIRWEPDRLTNELVPPVGGGAFSSNGHQAQLAATAVTAFQTIALYVGIEVTQISAKTVKKRLTDDADANKVKIRDHVLAFFPELKNSHPEWTKEFDEPDAIGTGLVELGYSTNSNECGNVLPWRKRK
jgi:Holliday junction resolvasome RuvABC endonuclease subunit